MSMGTWLVPRIELTPDQLRVVEIPPTAHKVISGLPGSGKTQVLVHRAAYLRDKYRVPKEKFRIFILTNVLRDYIRSGLIMLDVPQDSVCTFDSWCIDFHRKYISNHLPWNNEAEIYDFLQIKKAILSCLKIRKDLRVALDFALVDEGQDLAPESFAILQYIAQHVTVFADYLQQIYETGAKEQAILETLGLPRQTAILLDTYRNSPDVTQLASYFIANDEKRLHYLAQARNNQCERERPLLFVARSYNEEMDRLVAIIKQRQIMNQRVGIIVPQNKQVFGFAKGLQERGVEVEAASHRNRTGRANSIQFDNLIPKIASYHSAKGLTFDCVLLPRLTKQSFMRFSSDIRQRLLFVGMARATQWIYLSVVEGKESEEFPFFQKAVNNNHLIIQYGAEQKSTKKSVSEVREEDEDEFSVL